MEIVAIRLTVFRHAEVTSAEVKEKGKKRKYKFAFGNFHKQQVDTLWIPNLRALKSRSKSKLRSKSSNEIFQYFGMLFELIKSIEIYSHLKNCRFKFGILSFLYRE